MTQAAMDNDTMVAVTPEDRELVYGLLMPAARSSLQKLALEYIRDGKSDDADAVQQVARHRHKSERTGAGERETVARVIHQCLRPVNMMSADWDSGAILGANNSWRRSVYSTADHILAALSQSTAGEDGLAALQRLGQEYDNG